MKEETIIKENKMGIMPVNRLLITMSLPMMLSMLIQALYNIVDSHFIAKISEDALAAVTLAFPVQIVLIGINAGTGVGINALLSKRLGQKNFEQANKTAANAIFLAFAGYLIMLILGLTCSRLYYQAQTDVAEIIEMGTSYISICMIFSFGIFFLITFEKLLQSTGRTLHSMVCQLLGAVINIFLDPILIFGYLGFPALGVAGAAWATVFGQIVSSVLALILNIKLNHDLKFKLAYLKPDKEIIKRIYIVGVPSIIMNCLGSVMIYGLNKILLSFSTTAATVLGSYYKLQSFIFMPVFGMNNGIIPIIAYNYGAKNKERIIKTMKLGMIYATAIMLLGLLVMVLCADALLAIFNASDNMLKIGRTALKIISISYVFAGFNIVSLSVCQALRHGVLSMMAAFIRQLIVLLPAGYILANTLGLDAVWWSFPIAEIVTFIVCVFFIKRIYDRQIRVI